MPGRKSGEPQQPKQQETTSPKESRDRRQLEQMRSLAESDPQLFAMRALHAIEALLTESIPYAEQVKDGRGQKLDDRFSYALKYPLDPIYPGLSNDAWESRGYLSGLTDTFRNLSEKILGKPTAEENPTGK